MTEDQIARECYKHRTLINKICHQRGLKPHHADDLMQEVVIYVVSYWRKYGIDFSRSFGGLVRTSAVQRAKNITRKNTKAKFIVTDSRFNGADTAESPEQVVTAEYERTSAVERCGQCTFDARALIEALEAGLIAPEIAEHDELSVNTVHARIRRIRELLK